MTRPRPPISTDRSGLRACWTKDEGAVEHKLLASPRGIRTRSPSMSAPAWRQSSSARGLSEKVTPTSSRIPSALFSMISIASSVRISKLGTFRSMNFLTSTVMRVRSLRRAAPPPRRRREELSLPVMILHSR